MVVLKSGGAAMGQPGALLRKGLVIFQFTLSAVVIVGTLVIQSQLEYLGSKSLGYEKEDLISIRLRGSLFTQWQTFKEDVVSISGVLSASGATGTPVEAMISMQDDENGTPFRIYHYAGDSDYLKTMGMEIIAGRDFSEDIQTDRDGAIIINARAAQKLGLPENPVGEEIAGDVIIGIVGDFHMTSLHEEISPTFISSDRENYAHLIVRLNPENVAGALAGIGALWSERAPEYPFEFAFQDDKLERQYSSEENLAKFFGIFSGLVIIIACLGLFGLAAFTTEQRTKEMGIRKVLGATARQVVFLLSKDITIPVLFALILAAPVAYFGSNLWLAEFAYHTAVTPMEFFYAGLFLLGIAWLTVSYRALRAASANPVEALRQE